MQAIVDTLQSYFEAFLQFFVNVAESIKDFITDLPAILLEGATKFIVKFLEWASGYCSYCLGGTTLEGSGSAVSVFARQIESAYSALSPCVIYALTQSGIVGDLQILSCAMVVWSTFRIVSLVRSIV